MTLTPIQKLAKLALDNPELRPALIPIIRQAVADAPETTDIYQNKIDHGYEQPIAGGTDVMKRLQDQFLIEQGREPREKNPRLAFCQALQRELVAMLMRDSHGKVARERARNMVTKFAAETGTTIVVNAAVEDIMDYAVAVALDPVRLGHIISKHTAKED